MNIGLCAANLPVMLPLWRFVRDHVPSYYSRTISKIRIRPFPQPYNSSSSRRTRSRSRHHLAWFKFSSRSRSRHGTREKGSMPSAYTNSSYGYNTYVEATPMGRMSRQGTFDETAADDELLELQRELHRTRPSDVVGFSAEWFRKRAKEKKREARQMDQ